MPHFLVHLHCLGGDFEEFPSNESLAVGEGPFNLPLLAASDLRGSTLLLVVVVVVVVVVTDSAEFSSLFL